MGTVLIVDDEADIRLVMSIALRGAGHQVLEASDGRSALAALDEHAVDLILLDLMMPVMDGWAFLWNLRDRGTGPPVVVVSARPDSGGDKHPPMGAIRYLHKPFPMEAVVAVVEEVLQPGAA